VVLGVGLLAGNGVRSRDVRCYLPVQFSRRAVERCWYEKKAGRSNGYIFGLWIGITLLSGLASFAGAALLGGASPQVLAVVQAVAAGALLTMIIDTMIPEAVEGEHKGTGLLAVLGLLVAFALSKT
jgi:ZIP family zinc transporter